VARPESRYVCGTCGATSLRWEGQCRSCGEWNTLAETPFAAPARSSGSRSAAARPVALSAARPASSRSRLASGIGELDRVLGGGLLAGSLVLIGGEPGIGKSTLMLALAAGVAETVAGGGVLYVSGEESADQLRLRAARLGLLQRAAGERISTIAETETEVIVVTAEQLAPALLIVDSVQTLTSAGLDGPAGTVGQVRASAALLQKYAKRSSVPVVLVGHVTKDGSLAGPKTLEHVVDAVVTLEGDRFAGLRLLRAAKNRFGSTQEVGVFKMTAEGLREVPDPGSAFLQSASLEAPGVCVAPTLEGTRPLLVEVQALVAPAGQANPRRTVAGLDGQRLALLIAVLGRRAGIGLSSHDVYASVVGGLTIEEPAIDLPLAVALASSLRDRPLVPGTVVCGEVGLTGELRPVAGLDRRLREAARLGFRRAVVPAARGRAAADGEPPAGLQVVRVGSLREALAASLAPPVAMPAADERQPLPVVVETPT